jgi:DNA polymerase III subunit gamma/tau
MNSIQSDRIHHAYLLTGSRGIGKTSIARIFAKTIRCPNAKWDGQWLLSCNECSSCREIAAGNSVDVIEIDGASNNGVDSVREIRESAKFMPSSGSKKLYIIDEVHMLTTSAFNALLKTLEEPPAHVIFVLATTEPHKIPGTILSRCQRFDLKRFTAAQIQQRLEEVAKGEEISIDSGALVLLSRAADGSMRDALSLFDQAIAYAGKKISAAQIRDSIGLIESQTQLGILRGIFARDAKSAIELVGEAYRAGHELKLLARNLLEYLHAAILIKIGIESTGLELAPDEVSELRKIAELRELEEIELFFQAFQNGIEWIARSPQPKLVLEVLIVKCASSEALVAISGPSQGSPRSNEGGPSKKPAISHSAPKSEANPSTTQSATQPAAQTAKPAPKTGDLPKASLLFAASSPMAMKKTATPVSETIANLGASRIPVGPKSFEGFIAHVRATRPAIANALENAVCASFPTTPEKDFIVTFSPENDALYHGLLTSTAALAEFQKLTGEYFGTVKRVLVEVKESTEVSLAERREQDYANREKIAKDAAANHPLITEARALFGGELGPIELTNPGEETGKK